MLRYGVMHNVFLGSRVRCYRNLNDGGNITRSISVLAHDRSPDLIDHYGKVICHGFAFELSAVEFKVSQAGYKRVLTEKKKNVHAFVQGIVNNYFVTTTFEKSLIDFLAYFNNQGAKNVTYNPYTSNFFYLKDTGNPVSYADSVLVSHRGILAINAR